MWLAAELQMVGAGAELELTGVAAEVQVVVAGGVTAVGQGWWCNCCWSSLLAKLQQGGAGS
jgi:hypothetical protein